MAECAKTMRTNLHALVASRHGNGTEMDSALSAWWGSKWCHRWTSERTGEWTKLSGSAKDGRENSMPLPSLRNNIKTTENVEERAGKENGTWGACVRGTGGREGAGIYLPGG